MIELINGLKELGRKDQFRIEYGVIASVDDGISVALSDGIELHDVIFHKEVAPKLGTKCVVGIVGSQIILLKVDKINEIAISIQGTNIVVNESNIAISTTNCDVTIGNKIAISSNGVSLKEILTDLTVAIAAITPILGVPLPNDIANITRKINTIL